MGHPPPARGLQLFATRLSFTHWLVGTTLAGLLWIALIEKSRTPGKYKLSPTFFERRSGALSRLRTYLEAL